MTLACIGICLLAAGTAMYVGQPKTVNDGPARTASQQPVVPHVSSPSPLIFDPPILICWFLVSTQAPQSDALLQKFGSELAARVAELTDREITFVAPDAKDGVGSIRFNDAHRQRWIMHTRLRVEMTDEFGNTPVLLQCSSSNPIAHENNEQLSLEEFLVEWQAVRDAVMLPISDAAADFDEIQGLSFNSPRE